MSIRKGKQQHENPAKDKTSQLDNGKRFRLNLPLKHELRFLTGVRGKHGDLSQDSWPSDVLFLYHVAPMAMALFLSDDSVESRVYRWQRWLDFLQIGIVSFSAYLFFLYVPIRSVRRPEDINALYWWVFTWRNFILAFTFVLRAVLTKIG